MKGGIGLRRKISAFDHYLSYFYLLRLKEKNVKSDACWRTLRPYKFRKLQHSTRIVKKSSNSKQIIQILQPIISIFFRRICIWFIFYNTFIFYDLIVNFVYILFHIFQECSKIQRQRNIILLKQNQKYYEILTIYECVKK